MLRVITRKVAAKAAFGRTLLYQAKAHSTKVDSFLSGSSSVYVEQMYDLWRQDPKR